MEFIKPLEPLNLTSGNVYSDWKDLSKQFDLYNMGSGLSTKEENQQVSAMVCLMGKHTVKLLKAMTWAEGKSKDNLKEVIEAFEAHFKARSSKSSLRQTFRDRTQKDGESLIALAAGYDL